MFQTDFRENQNTHFVHFFFEKRAVYVGKYRRAREGTDDDIIRHMRIVRGIEKS